MATEIERKFLVHHNLWSEIKKEHNPECIIQGYLSKGAERTVRIRIKANQGFLTIKSKNEGIIRKEFEYTIPLKDAREMIEMCLGAIISKSRYTIVFNGLRWEVDEFSGDNEGLIIAEVELKSEHQEIIIPNWVSKEVSEDTRYFNSSLVSHPFKFW